MDTNLLSNIHKLFSERIDIFSSVEFNKVGTLSAQKKICLLLFGPWFYSILNESPLHISLLLGVCDDRNHQNQSENIPGVCPSAYFRALRAAANPSGLPLPADVPVALCFWREPRAFPAGWDRGKLCSPMSGPGSDGAECDRGHLWERLRFSLKV